MNKESLLELIRKIQGGEIEPEKALELLAALPFADLGEAKVDIHRDLRQGFPEVILGEGKTPEQIARIAAKLAEGDGPVLITRVSAQASEKILEIFPGGDYNPSSRTLVYNEDRIRPLGKGVILVISAGTSDLSVAEEASVTAEVMGNEVERLYDVGVSGIHRLFGHVELIREAKVIIVVAGMEGALSSVVGGIVSVPVIAVPTSIGYGASFNGLAALLGMLNSCASNVAVVNIDNGFGAAAFASTINRL